MSRFWAAGKEAMDQQISKMSCSSCGHGCFNSGAGEGGGATNIVRSSEVGTGAARGMDMTVTASRGVEMPDATGGGAMSEEKRKGEVC